LRPKRNARRRSNIAADAVVKREKSGGVPAWVRKAVDNAGASTAVTKTIGTVRVACSSGVSDVSRCGKQRVKKLGRPYSITSSARASGASAKAE